MAVTGPVTEVIRAAGDHVPALLARVEERLAELAAGHGATLAEHARRDDRRRRQAPAPAARVPRRRRRGGRGRSSAPATAVELVHSATLVHDDVLDAAALRRGVPTVVATAGRGAATATGDLLFAQAFAELAATAAPTRSASCPTRARARRGRAAQRADAWDADVAGRALPARCELKTARLFEAACRLGALEGPDARRGRARRLRPPHRARLPAPRRRPRRLRPGLADRQAPRHRPARRHGHAALHPRPRARPGRWRRSTRARSATRDGRGACATASRRPARSTRRAAARARDRRRRQGRGSRDDLPGRQRAALELVANGVVARYA